MQNKECIVDEEKIQRFVGLADCCELLARAFAFPDERLSEALSLGAFCEDAQSSLRDAGACDAEIDRVGELFAFAGKLDPSRLFTRLRRFYSWIYLTPGSAVPVFPYEAPFRFAALGQKGSPALFFSPVAIDVENRMRRAGVAPYNARKEPVDSVWNEFSFLSFLFGSCATCLYNGDEDGYALWESRIGSFWESHGRCWLKEFMLQTANYAEKNDGGEAYFGFAVVGQMVFSLVEDYFKDKVSPEDERR